MFELGYTENRHGFGSMSIAGAIMQLPSGFLVDSTKFKRLILALSAILISFRVFDYL